mgnify:CR=1 FL=1
MMMFMLILMIIFKVASILLFDFFKNKLQMVMPIVDLKYWLNVCIRKELMKIEMKHTCVNAVRIVKKKKWKEKNVKPYGRKN